jgi:pimeloyl-ACP methyl ester carboxylesterase
MHKKIKSPIVIIIMAIILTSYGCQKAVYENLPEENSEPVLYSYIYKGDDVYVEAPKEVVISEEKVSVYASTEPLKVEKAINAVHLSKVYSLSIPVRWIREFKKNEEIRFGINIKNFEEGYDFFLVVVNDKFELPFIARAVKGEDGFVYAKLMPSFISKVFDLSESEYVKISFQLVRNPDFESKAFTSKFYLLKYNNGVYTLSENVVSPPPGQIPVIIIHGWQIPIWSSDLYSYARGVSEEIVKYLTNMGLESKYEFYAYAYDPDYDIYNYSAYSLAQYINRYFANSDTLILIAHSMGGIVARVYAKYYKPSNKVIKRIVTLGTPHHGTPFANLIFGGYVVPFVVPINPWLRWDNLYWTWAMYLHFYLFNGNPYLDALNYNYPNWSRVYNFVGYSISSSHPLYYVTGSGLLSFMGFGDNDGLVNVESANASGYSTNRYYFYDTDHSELTYKSNALGVLYNLLR